MIDLTDFPNAKTEFEDFWYNRVETPEWKEKGYYYDYDYFHWDMLWGCFLRFFDSVGIDVGAERDEIGIENTGGFYSYAGENSVKFHKVREDAQKEAVIKAFEIREKQFMSFPAPEIKPCPKCKTGYLRGNKLPNRSGEYNLVCFNAKCKHTIDITFSEYIEQLKKSKHV